MVPEKSIDESGKERFHIFSVEDHLIGNYPDWAYRYSANPIKKV